MLVVLVAHPEQLPLQVAAHEHVHGALVLLAVVVLLPHPLGSGAVVLPVARTQAPEGVVGGTCLGPETHQPTRVVGLGVRGAGTEAMEALSPTDEGGPAPWPHLDRSSGRHLPEFYTLGRLPGGSPRSRGSATTSQQHSIWGREG